MLSLYRDNNTDVPMVEYHVNIHEMFQRQMNEETEYRGKRSVRYKEGKMLFIFGHDEAIFKQYLLTKTSWVSPNGETAIIPKDEGMGMMIPAFQSRKFGFGFEMREQLAKVNEYNKNKKYTDEKAAKVKRGNIQNHLLKEHS
jgi:hypothetical protein